MVVKTVRLSDRARAAAAERELRVLHELCRSGEGEGDREGDASFLVECLGVELERESATLLFVLEDAAQGSLHQVRQAGPNPQTGIRKPSRRLALR